MGGKRLWPNFNAPVVTALPTGYTGQVVSYLGNLHYYDWAGWINFMKKFVTFNIDGWGSVISTGAKGFVIVPYAMTITGWTLIADVSGSIVIDVWKDTYANHPPVGGDSIAGSEKPTLSSVIKNQDNTLTTWTTWVLAWDILRFNVDSVSTVKYVALLIEWTLT